MNMLTASESIESSLLELICKNLSMRHEECSFCSKINETLLVKNQAGIYIKVCLTGPAPSNPWGNKRTRAD